MLARGLRIATCRCPVSFAVLPAPIDPKPLLSDLLAKGKPCMLQVT